jgi:hypothetical protein
MDSARPWCDGILNNGAGKGKGLEDNAESAKTMAFSANAVATQIGHLRQAMYDLPLHDDYPQSVRSALINQMMLRQRRLQDLRTLLEQSAAGFLDFAHSRTYTGDTYPAAFDKLNSLVSRYAAPDDAWHKAIQDLKVKYTLRDADLAGRT